LLAALVFPGCRRSAQNGKKLINQCLKVTLKLEAELANWINHACYYALRANFKPQEQQEHQEQQEGGATGAAAGRFLGGVCIAPIFLGGLSFFSLLEIS
jgi:hypothetical protein